MDSPFNSLPATAFISPVHIAACRTAFKPIAVAKFRNSGITAGRIVYLEKELAGASAGQWYLWD
jgi:hypothetical protein